MYMPLFQHFKPLQGSYRNTLDVIFDNEIGFTAFLMPLKSLKTDAQYVLHYEIKNRCVNPGTQHRYVPMVRVATS